MSELRVPPHLKNYDTQYGNLASYKYYTRPAAYRLYGSFSNAKSKHQAGMQDILQIMFANGACTTWDMAKLMLRTSDVSLIRTKEKAYRRLFLGRYDTKKQSGGMLDLGLVVREKKGPYSRYRLSLHGILYCMDVLNPSRDDVDRMARMYAGVLPKVFGKWEALKAAVGTDIYKLRILAKGILLDNSGSGNAQLCEIMSFLQTKYARRFESIPEEDLADQISYWFYTFMMYYKSASSNARMSQGRIDRARRMLLRDPQMREWYRRVFEQAVGRYQERLRSLTKDSSWIL